MTRSGEPPRKITIRDVAREAHVSPATASRALNAQSQSGPVSAALRHRVEMAAHKLGYVAPRVNRPARPSQPRRAMTIGCVIPDLTNPFFAELAQSVVEQARDRGYQTIIYVSADARQQTRVAHDLLQRRVDGVVAVPAGDPDARETAVAWQALIARQCKVVFMDRKVPGLAEHTDSVIMNNYDGGRQAAEYLTTNGHGRIGVLAGPDTARTHVDRFSGFSDAYAEVMGHGLESELIQRCTFERESRENAARALLSLKPAVSAIFATANQLGSAVLAIVQERRKTMIPPPRPEEEPSLVMFDDVDWAHFTTPAITVVSNPPKAIGVAAVDLLLRRLAGQEAKDPQHIRLNRAQLVIRESVRNLRARSTSRPLARPGASAPSEQSDSIFG
jgi:LacI family transcriptional regulator